MEIKDILKLISKLEFSKAEENINKELEKENDSRVKSKLKALLGEIYISAKNEQKSERKAKIFFEESINMGTSIKLPYYRYDELEEDNTIAIGYLKKGINEFPNDIELYKRIFKRENKIEKIKIINEVIKRKIEDNNLYYMFIEFTFENEKYELSKLISEKVEKLDNNEKYKNECILIKIASGILAEETIDKDKYIKELEKVIDMDYRNVFKYLHYLLLIYLENERGNISKVKEILMKIPIKRGIDNFYFWDDLIEIDLEVIYRKIFNNLERNLRGEDLIKIKALKCLYLDVKYENLEEVNYGLKDIKGFEKILDTFPENDEIYSAIYNMYANIEQYAEAIIFAINSSMKNYKIRELFEKLKVRFCIEEATTQELIKVVDKLIEIMTNINEYNININYLLITFVDDVIKELHKRKMYEYVYMLTKGIDIDELLKISNIFEVAYSCKDDTKSKRLYEYLIEKNPEDSASYNNIGVIYKRQGDLVKAKKCFEKACEYNKEDEIASRNLNDTNEKIEDLYEGYENVKKENPWILNKLKLLYSYANDDNIITCSTKEQEKVLKTSPEKAYEVMANFISNGYIEKVSSNDEYGRNQYRINDLVKEYVNIQQEKIEENKEYENICNTLNIDYLEKIGYSKKLINKLEKIQNEDVLEIMKRDFKECAIAMASRQQKTTAILAGSMAEALLYYVVTERKINKYKLLKEGKEKEIRIKDMGLADLLEVATNENIIHRTDYHLSQFVRDYRNLIHPSVEIRKQIQISDVEVDLIWSILKKLINDIL